MESYTISVVIPTFKRQQSLKKLLDCLCKQTFPSEKREVVVVDDQSGEDFSKINKAYSQELNLTIIESKTKGRPGARNTGVQTAKGKIIVFIDDDVIINNEFLQYHYEAHINQNCLIVGRLVAGDSNEHLWTVVTNHRLTYHDKHTGINPDNLPFYTVTTGNLSVSKKMFQELGGFDEVSFQKFAGEDFDFGKRCVDQKGCIMYQPLSIATHFEGFISLSKLLKTIKYTVPGHVIFLNKYKDIINNNKNYKHFPVKLGKTYSPIQSTIKKIIKKLICIPPILELFCIFEEFIWKIYKRPFIRTIAIRTYSLLQLRYYEKAVKLYWKD